MIDKNKSRMPVLFPLVGFLSLVWFLVRVLPKPNRASYPCQRAAAPFASSFVLWLLGMVGSTAGFRPARESTFKVRHQPVFIFILIVVMTVGLASFDEKRSVYAEQPIFSVNQPIGNPQGVHPGRVVWVYEPSATNEWCSNKYGDYWWYDTSTETKNNTDPDRVEAMVSQAIQALTGENSDAAAWEALFRHYNQTQGRSNTGYQPGEKIAIKVNLTSGGWGNVNTTTYEKTRYLGVTETSPQVMLAILKQLVNKAGIMQSDIYIGDPHRYFFNQFYSKLYPHFPQVQYLDWKGKNDRTWAQPSVSYLLQYSDGTTQDKLPKAFVDATYIINIAALKAHNLAGVSLNAKNHFGSTTNLSASHLHYALPGQTSGLGQYRNLVDLKGHRHLGGKTILYLIDGLWGANDALSGPGKWFSAPFYGDWPSSLFASQDTVAIESVGIDFLQAEYTTGGRYPHIYGTEDYLLQAADPVNWPAHISYDPEGDGTLLSSLGVYERWNNPIDKQYTKNLGSGAGIELISLSSITVRTGILATIDTVEEKSQNPGKFTLNRTGDMSTDLTVFFTLSGTASEGSDYLPISDSVTIEAGTPSAAVTVTPINDSLAEPNETVVLTLSNSNGYAINPTMASATVTIRDGSIFTRKLFLPILQWK